MAAREVNVHTSGWKATGTNVSVPQYEMSVLFQWVDAAGVSHEGTRTVRWPNVLANMPTAYVADRMREMLLDYGRQVLGIDG